MHIPHEITSTAERQRELLEAAIAEVPPGDPIPGWLVDRLGLALRSLRDVHGELRLIEAYRASHGDSFEALRFRDRELELRLMLHS